MCMILLFLVGRECLWYNEGNIMIGKTIVRIVEKFCWGGGGGGSIGI